MIMKQPNGQGSRLTPSSNIIPCGTQELASWNGRGPYGPERSLQCPETGYPYPKAQTT